MDTDTLREVVLQRKNDVWEECRAEENEVVKLEAERLALLDIHSRSEQTARMMRRLGYAGSSTVGIIAGIYVIVTVFTAQPAFFIWVCLGVLGAAVFILLEGIVLAAIRRRSARRALDVGLEELGPRLEAAEKRRDQALREKGVRGTLREIINVQAPSYSQTLKVQRAAGLAELRDPLYEIRTEAKKRIRDLLDTMPGGSIGVSGPRGVGKTTLLRDFCSPGSHSRRVTAAVTSAS